MSQPEFTHAPPNPNGKKEEAVRATLKTMGAMQFVKQYVKTTLHETQILEKTTAAINTIEPVVVKAEKGIISIKGATTLVNSVAELTVFILQGNSNNPEVPEELVVLIEEALRDANIARALTNQALA